MSGKGGKGGRGEKGKGGGGAEKGKGSDRGKFVELPGAKEGEVVVRFPPEASGYLHVGHAKAALLNQHYQQAFKGRLIMRFDDTNPAKEDAHFEKIILEDLELLGIKPDVFTHSSDHFPRLLELCEQLLRDGKAFVDDTPAEQMKAERDTRTNSRNRDNSPATNLQIWEEMKKGSPKGLPYCVRLKLDMSSNNGTMRDPTIFRCKAEPHVRTGTTYKVYPTYDFTCPVVDSAEGVTHALRTTEYTDRDEQYAAICAILGIRKPHVHAYSRLNLMNTVMSKRKLTKLVEAGLVEGWDDPRFPTVRGVRRRGMTVQGLREFIVAQGSSRSINQMDWNKIWAFNKQVIDPVAPRYTALKREGLVKVKVEGGGDFEARPTNLHPKTAEVGQKEVWFGPEVWVEPEDAAVMKPGDTVTYVNWGNLKITSVSKDLVKATLDLENKDYKKTLKVTWLAAPAKGQPIPVVATHFDHIITKPVLGKEENWEDFIAPQSKWAFQLSGEPAMASLKKGDIVQLQRKGFYIVDSPYVAQSELSGQTLPLVLFDIPDGHNKTSGTALAVPQTSQPTTAAAPKAEKSSGGGMSKGDALLLEIEAVGGKIRELKGAKADKALVEAEVKTLLSLKAAFKEASGTEWGPKLVEAAKARAAAPAPAAAAATGASEADALLLAIKASGDKVRDLKAAKAPKPDIDAAVKALLDGKAKFKQLTGKDWNPKLVDAVKPASAAQPSAASASTNSSGDQILLDIKAAGDKVRDLKSAKAPKPDIDAAVKALLDGKAKFKEVTGKDWGPKLIDAVKAPASAPQANGSVGSASPGDQILLDIKDAGDKVRDLKSAKAAKPDIDAAVKTLLDLKTKFKEATGKDWGPKLLDAVIKAPVAAPQTNGSVGGTASPGDQILLDIKAAGDKVRDLKTAKAAKPDIDAAVKTLLDLKTKFKEATGKDWGPKLIDGVKAPAAPSAPVPQAKAASPPAAAGSGSQEDQLLLQIKGVGDAIRSLKAAGAGKSAVEVEVKKLLALKEDFKAATGKTWNPDMGAHLKSASPAPAAQPAAAKPKASSPASGTPASGSLGPHVALLQQIKAAGDKVRQLKTSKAAKEAVDASVAELLKLKAAFKEKAGQDWNPNLLGEAGKAGGSTGGGGASGAVGYDDVTAQGAKVRSLKDAKAPKADVDAAVALLLQMKKDFEAASGQPYKPPASAAPSRGGGGGGGSGGGGGKKKEEKKKPAPKEEKPGSGGKQTKLGISVKKEENFADWYSEVITKAEMIEYYDVSGCYVLRPWSYAIWEVISRWFDDEIKKLGVSNLYFPMFVSQAALEKEKEHIADFSPEVAWVTRSGSSEMAEPIAIRPTSETVMYPTFAKWCQSHRDLPIKINQWCNVVRWEFKHPTPFLRTREFLWQEGHTAHASKADAEAEVLTILDLYARIYSELLAVPVIKGRKTEKEKFAGGDFTTTVEAYIPANGRGVQGATSHHLGQNFSKMFNVSFEDPADPSRRQFAFQNSWGFTTRTIGVAAMVHGDNMGLVLPPRVAKVQAIVVACGITASLGAAEKAALYASSEALVAELCDAGLRAESDLRENYSPGWKFNHWELKGVPLRVEVGPRDLAKGEAVAVRRVDGAKKSFARAEAVEWVAAELEDVHATLLGRAQASLDAHVVVTESWDAFLKALEDKCFIQAPFCGRPSCEEAIKKDSAKDEPSDAQGPAMGAKSLCVPFRQPKDLVPGLACVAPACTAPPTSYTMFGRSY